MLSPPPPPAPLTPPCILKTLRFLYEYYLLSLPFTLLVVIDELQLLSVACVGDVRVMMLKRRQRQQQLRSRERNVRRKTRNCLIASATRSRRLLRLPSSRATRLSRRGAHPCSRSAGSRTSPSPHSSPTCSVSAPTAHLFTENSRKRRRTTRSTTSIISRRRWRR